jgi:uncharacterized protein (TIGR02145 family)
MKQLILSLSLAAILLSCKKTDSTPTHTTPNKDTTQTSIAKYGAGVTDIDGNKYKTVIIGTQEWMGENLKVSKYNDGSTIPNVVDNVEWSKLTSAAFCNYNNSDSIATIYGKLYNWYAVDTKNLCPTGWHVPTKSEVVKLIISLKGDTLSINGNGQTVFNHVGLKVKEKGTIHWENPNNSNNLSLLSILPNGYRVDAGDFSAIKRQANFWISNESSESKAFYFGTTSESILEDLVFIETYGKGFGGFAIRCIKD